MEVTNEVLGVLKQRRLTMQQNQTLLDDGRIFVNMGTTKMPRTFKLLGKTYITNRKKDTAYALDDPFWKPLELMGLGAFILKLSLIWNGAKSVRPRVERPLSCSKIERLLRYYA